MIECDLTFTTPYSAYAFWYEPKGKEAYDLAKGKNFDYVEKLHTDVVVKIPITLAIQSKLFEKSFHGTVNVEKNSLLWAVSWYVENNTLKPLIYKQLIVDEWERAAFPTDWAPKRNYSTKKLYRTRLAKKIGVLEKKLTSYKDKLLNVTGYPNFDDLTRCTKNTCVFPHYYDKCIGKFANICEAF